MSRRSGRRAGRAVRVLAVAATLALTLAACSSGDATGGSGTNYVAGEGTVTGYALGHRDPAPAVTGTTLEGTPFDLASYRGKVVVLNFWASWCSPCRAEGPALQRLASGLAATGVQFVGVDIRDDDKDAARAFLANIGATYPNVDGSDGHVELAFHGLVPPQAVPSTIVIDRSGRIAARVIGPTTEPRLKALLAPLAAEKA